MGTITWRDRLRNWWYDACHPVTAFERAMAFRYCKRFDCIIVDYGTTPRRSS